VISSRTSACWLFLTTPTISILLGIPHNAERKMPAYGVAIEELLGQLLVHDGDRGAGGCVSVREIAPADQPNTQGLENLDRPNTRFSVIASCFRKGGVTVRSGIPSNPHIADDAGYKDTSLCHEIQRRIQLLYHAFKYNER